MTQQQQQYMKSHYIPSSQPLTLHSITSHLLNSQTLAINAINDMQAKIIKKQYRNATYIGTLLNATLRDGLGLMLADNGQIVFGEWKEGKAEGAVVYMSQRLRVMGEVNAQCRLEGVCVLRVSNDVKNGKGNQKMENNKKDGKLNINSDGNAGTDDEEGEVENMQVEPMTVYCSYKHNTLYGKCIVIYKQNIYICNNKNKYNNNNNNNSNSNSNNNSNNNNNNNSSSSQQVQIVDKLKYTRATVSQVCRQVLGEGRTLELHQFITNMIDRYNNNNNMLLSKYKPTIIKYPTHNNININSNNNNNGYSMHNKNINVNEDCNIFYGFATHHYTNYNTNNINTELQFGFVLHNDELLSAGEHSQGLPHGLATLYQLPFKISMGTFHHGKLQGEAFQYYMAEYKSKYIFANFNANNKYSNSKFNSNVVVIRQGANWPAHMIRDYCKDKHIKSIYFDPSYYKNNIQLPILHISNLYAALCNYEANKKQESNYTNNNNKITNNVIKKNYDDANNNLNSHNSKSNMSNFDQMANKNKNNKYENNFIMNMNMNNNNVQMHDSNNANYTNGINTVADSNKNNQKIHKNSNPNINSANKLPNWDINNVSYKNAIHSSYESAKPLKMQTNLGSKRKYEDNYMSQKPKQLYNAISKQYKNIQKYQPQNTSFQHKQKLTQNKQYQSLYSNFIKNRQNSKQHNKQYQQQEIQVQQQAQVNKYSSISPQNKFYLKTIVNSENKNKNRKDNAEIQDIRYSYNRELIKYHDNSLQKQRISISSVYNDNEDQPWRKRRVNTEFSKQKYSNYTDLRFNKK